jgi:hypothetical protein
VPNVILEFSSDVAGLKPAVDILKSIGAISDEDYKKLQALNSSFKANAQATTQSAKQSEKAENAATKSVQQHVKAQKELNTVIKDGAVKQATAELAKHTKEVANNTEKLKSGRARLREIREELLQLDPTVKANSKRIAELRAEGGKLDDDLKDVSATLRNLGSDTRVFDGLLSAATGVVGAFTAVQGVTALVGDENEDLQKALLKVNAAMAVLQGLQAIQNVLQKESAAMLLLNEVRTYALAAATTTYNTVVGTSTGLVRVLRIAMASLTGVGIIGFLILLITNFDQVTKAARQFWDALQDISSIFKSDYNAAIQGMINKHKTAITTIEDMQKAYEALEKTVAPIRDKFQMQWDNINKQLRRNIDLMVAKGASDQKILTAEVNANNTRIAQINKEIAAYQTLIKQYAANSVIALEYGKLINDLNNERLDLINASVILLIEGERKYTEEFKKFAVERAKLIFDEVKAYKDLFKTIGDESRTATDQRYQYQLTKQKEFEAKSLASNKAYQDSYNAEVATAKQQQLDYETRLRERVVETAMQTAQVLLDIVKQQQEYEFQLKFNNLEKQREAELNNVNLTNEQKASINAKYDLELKKVRRQQFEANKRAAIADALLQAPLAILRAIKDLGVVGGVLAGTLVAAQVLKIATAQPPQFFKGGYTGDGSPHNEAGIVHKREFVIDAKTTEKLGLKGKSMAQAAEMLSPVLTMPHLLIPKESGANSNQGIDYDKLGKSIAAHIPAQKNVTVNVDKNGVTVNDGYNRRTYMNTKFRYN